MPCPCRPPNTKPTLTMEGITATHFAESMSSSGIPLSGVPMTSSRTVAAASIRFTWSDGSSAAKAVVDTNTTALARKIAASTANTPAFNFNALIANPSARIRAIRSRNEVNSRDRYLVVIGELRIANRRQCRFPPEQQRNDKEAVLDNIVQNGLVTIPLLLY